MRPIGKLRFHDITKKGKVRRKNLSCQWQGLKHGQL